MKELKDLPIEIWQHIMAFVPFKTRYCFVSKLFNSAVHGCTAITVRINKATNEKGLGNIIKKFPELQSIDFQPGQYTVAPGLVHEIALQFTGSKSLQSITSVSDCIYYGLPACSNLVSLSLPFLQTGARSISIPNNIDLKLEEHRDFLCILTICPKLAYLRLDSPIFNLHQPTIVNNLKEIYFTSLTDHSAKNFGQVLDGSLTFPRLEKITLDFDYNSCPPDLLDQLAKSCPNIKELRLKYSLLPDNFINRLCNLFPLLTSLRLTRCDFPNQFYTWADFIAEISKKLTKLKKLHLKHCAMLGEIENLPEPIQGQVNHGLNELKVFDINEGRVDEQSFLRILHLFPNTTILRMDLTANCFPGISEDFVQQVEQKLQNVETLELRFSKPYGDEKRLLMDSREIKLPKLKHLSFWGTYKFPNYLIKPNESRLESLHLNYALMGPCNKVIYSLPKLKKFSIRANTHLAESICSETIVHLLKYSADLEHLEIHAISHRGANMDPELVSNLICQSPNLKSFSTVNFRYRKCCIDKLISAWPLLEKLQLRGNGAVGHIDAMMEKDFLYEFIAKHSKLELLSLGIHGLQVDHTSADPAHNFDDSFSRQYPYLAGASRYGVFRAYESFLKSKFPQTDFIIRGPVEEAFNLQ